MSHGLRIDHLTVRYGSVTAVEDVSLVVGAGEVLCLLGASGSGKTTLLRSVAGFERAASGSIHLGDRLLDDGATWLPPERRDIGMVFQALELWPHMTVAEHIAFALPGRPRGRKATQHEQVRRLAARVDLGDELLGRRPQALSGGEQQRVAIARTLAGEPQVLLFDEPLANLDPHLRQDLRHLMGDLARERAVPALYVTHDPQEALAIGDQIAVLADARLQEVAAPATLYRSPSTLAGARALGPVTSVTPSLDWGLALTDDLRTALSDDQVAVYRTEDLAAEVAEDGGCVVRRARVAPGGFAVELGWADRPEARAWCHAQEALTPGTRVRLSALRGPVLVRRGGLDASMLQREIA